MRNKIYPFSNTSPGLKAGIYILHLQSILGHLSLEMTRRYVQMVEDDFGESHKEHGPIDSFLR